MVVVKLGERTRGILNPEFTNPLLKTVRRHPSFSYYDVEGFIVRPCGHKILLTRGKHVQRIWYKMLCYFNDNPCRSCRKERS